MKKVCRKAGLLGILLGLMLFAAGFAVHTTTVDVQAATTTGFRTVNGKTYYYKSGKKVKGWLTLGSNKYFLNTKTGVLLKGWQRSPKGPMRYFDSRTGDLRRLVGITIISNRLQATRSVVLSKLQVPL